MEYKTDRAWAEINLDNISSNIAEIRKLIPRRTDIMAIVKADAYGHGVMETVRTILDSGITRLGVSMLDEAIQLRKEGVTVPILVLGYTDPMRADEIVKYDITQTIFNNDIAVALSDMGVRLSRNVRVHVKVDTGMSRLGYVTGYSTVKEIADLGRLPRIIVEGMYTHFATADEKDDSYMNEQFEKFISLWNELNRIGLYIPLKHCANSAAIIRYPKTYMEIVRAGIVLYGLFPWGNDDVVSKSGLKIKLKPAMELKCRISMVKNVESGVPVSYGRKFVTRRPTRIATVPIGYADGYLRALSNKAKILVGGEYAPVIGNICMDQCMIDITDLSSDVKAGDIAVVMGCQGDKSITAEEIAHLCGTINYEIVSLIGRRVPRVYIKDGMIVNMVKYIL